MQEKWLQLKATQRLTSDPEMKKRILIVDDEDNMRQMVRLALEAEGYEVDDATNGLETFAILGSDSLWDVVLLDERMPGMEGIEVLRRIKVLAPKARVIMVTAFSSFELAANAIKLGAVDFIQKPTTPEIIRNAVKAALLREKHDSSGSGQRAESLKRDKFVTLNGFTIVRASERAGSYPQKDHEKIFIVKDPRGREYKVVVFIADEAVNLTAELGGRQIPKEDEFWMEQAERFLAAYIWNDGRVPAEGKLTLRGIDTEGMQALKARSK